MSDIAIYEDGSLSLATSVEKESIWLNQKQLCELFERDKSVVSRHIRNIFKEGELDREAVVAKKATTAADGKVYQVDYYNLDMIISLGYRINSKKATRFRKWATQVLKEYILQGYALDKARLQKEKLAELEATLKLIRRVVASGELGAQEDRGFVELIGTYAKSWALLQGNDDIAGIASTFHRFRAGEKVDEPGRYKAADLEEVARQVFVLTPGRYVSVAKEEDGIPFADKMAELTSQLYEHFDKSHKLKAAINRNLEVLGYGK